MKEDEKYQKLEILKNKRIQELERTVTELKEKKEEEEREKSRIKEN